MSTDRLVLRAAPTARSGWDTPFQQMAAQGDDVLLDGDSWHATAWEMSDWQW